MLLPLRQSEYLNAKSFLATVSMMKVNRRRQLLTQLNRQALQIFYQSMPSKLNPYRPTKHTKSECYAQRENLIFERSCVVVVLKIRNRRKAV